MALPVVMLLLPKGAKQILPLLFLHVPANFSLIHRSLPVDLPLIANNNWVDISPLRSRTAIHDIQHMFVKILSVNSVYRFDLTLVQRLYGYLLMHFFLLFAGQFDQRGYFIVTPVYRSIIDGIKLGLGENFVPGKQFLIHELTPNNKINKYQIFSY